MTDEKRPLGAQMSHAFKARGVDVIFGIPGVHNVELYRGIEEAGISHVLARHEQGAGFMADGYARASGKPGVAYVITGPGVCNIMTPMGQAYSDSVPVLVVASCLERTDSGMERGRLHEMISQQNAAASVCDWALTAPDARGAYKLIDQAFAEFEAERPRPKYIQVPIDVLGTPASAAEPPRRAPERPIARPEQVKEVADALRKARKPLFVFGGGAAKSSASARSVVETLNAAVFPTYAGKGVVSSDYPLNYGAFLGRGGSLAIIESADLVVVVGSTLSEVDLWRDKLGNTAPMVRIDIDPACLADTHLADVPVLGDAAAFLDALAGELQGHTASTDWEAAKVAKSKTAFRAETEAERPGIVAFIDALAEAVPENTRFTSDMTQFAYVAKEVYPMKRPAHWYHPTGFGTLGYALPAAIGAKFGTPDEPVVAIAGDYGFHYTMQELGVAVEHKLSLPIILWDNEKLKEIEDCMVDSQIAPNAVVALNPDFCALAEAFGARSASPDSLAAFQQAVRDALDADGPTLIYITPDANK